MAQSQSPAPHDDIVTLDAIELSQAIHARSISCVAVMEAYLRADRAAEPDRQRHRRAARAVRLPEGGRAPGSGTGGRALARLDAWLPAGDQGPRRRQGHSPRRRALRCSSSRSPRPTRSSSSGCGRPARSSSARPTRRNSAWARRPTTRSIGITRNAYDQSRTAGGSSGGAAVALALRMLPVADGSDHAGSLRNPAAFNNVLGLRPAYGRVPSATEEVFVPQMGVAGPMARKTCDLAALLAVQSGYDPRVPFSSARGAVRFSRTADARPEGPAHRLARRSRRPSADGGGRAGAVPRGAAGVRGARLPSSRMPASAIDPELVWRSWTRLRSWQVGAGLLPIYQRPRAARSAQARGALGGRAGTGAQCL